MGKTKRWLEMEIAQGYRDEAGRELTWENGPDNPANYVFSNTTHDPIDCCMLCGGKLGEGETGAHPACAASFRVVRLA